MMAGGVIIDAFQSVGSVDRALCDSAGRETSAATRRRYRGTTETASFAASRRVVGE
jgi:hypothetical protein